MGTDSRVTTTGPEGDTREDAYPKLVQFGTLPVGMAMVGAGSYGGRDFRSLVAETWRTCRGPEATSLAVQNVAERFAAVAGPIARDSGNTTDMNVLVAGFSPGEAFGELWEVRLPDGQVTQQARPQSQTFVWRGRADAVKTLWWGANLGVLRHTLESHGLNHQAATAVMDDVKTAAAWGPERINWGMPLTSAVDLIRFQLEVQIQSERFLPGRAACGAPTQLLAINDAGLHWVDRPFEPIAQVSGIGPNP